MALLNHNVRVVAAAAEASDARTPSFEAAHEVSASLQN